MLVSPAAPTLFRHFAGIAKGPFSTLRMSSPFARFPLASMNPGLSFSAEALMAKAECTSGRSWKVLLPLHTLACLYHR